MTYFSFIYALLYFVIELLFYGTVTIGTILPMLVITILSIVYMPTQWYQINGTQLFQFLNNKSYIFHDLL